MIIANDYTGLGESTLVDNGEFLGEAHEFGELVGTALTEMHNLTVAMARMEYQALTESVSQAVLTEGVREYIARAGATLKKWWDAFVAWLGSLWTRLKDVFIKRADWLKRNKSVIAGATAAQLNGIKGNLGDEVLGTDFSGAAAKAINEAKGVVDAAGQVDIGPKQPVPFRQRAMDMLRKPLKRWSEKKGISANVMESLIGESREVAVDAGMVSKLLKIAEDTFKAADQMRGAKDVANAAIKHAQGMARVTGGESTAVNAKIAALRECGPMVQSYIGAYASAIGTANGQVMPLLVKIAKAANKGNGQSTNESTSLLDALM